MRELEKPTGDQTREALSQQRLSDLVYGYLRDNPGSREELLGLLLNQPNVVAHGSPESPAFILQNLHVREVVGNTIRDIAQDKVQDPRYEIARVFDGWSEKLQIARKTPSGKIGLMVNFELKEDKTALPSNIRFFRGNVQVQNESTGSFDGKITSFATFTAKRTQRG